MAIVCMAQSIADPQFIGTTASMTGLMSATASLGYAHQAGDGDEAAPHRNPGLVAGQVNLPLLTVSTELLYSGVSGRSPGSD